jgi:hypothetical protein
MSALHDLIDRWHAEAELPTMDHAIAEIHEHERGQREMLYRCAIELQAVVERIRMITYAPGPVETEATSVIFKPGKISKPEKADR